MKRTCTYRKFQWKFVQVKNIFRKMCVRALFHLIKLRKHSASLQTEPIKQKTEENKRFATDLAAGFHSFIPNIEHMHGEGSNKPPPVTQTKKYGPIFFDELIDWFFSVDPTGIEGEADKFCRILYETKRMHFIYLFRFVAILSRHWYDLLSRVFLTFFCLELSLRNESYTYQCKKMSKFDTICRFA